MVATATALFPDLIGSWLSVSDKDPRAIGLYRRHYSAAQNRSKPRQRASALSGRSRRGSIAGTGDYLALLTAPCNALFVWKRYPGGISRDGKQRGVNCSVFRNEGPILSSTLIREACDLAWSRWPGQRLYTYVWDAKVRSVNPGYCFKKAGWRVCGRNADGRLTILEILPTTAEAARTA